MSRPVCLAFAVGQILAGLLLRFIPWGLPLAVRHSGGGFLWGGMIFMLAAAIRPAAWTRWGVVALSLVIVVVVESSRLYHAPALDALRLTLPGQLLLGRIFSPLNMLVDGAGVAAAAAATWRLPWRLSGGLADGSRI